MAKTLAELINERVSTLKIGFHNEVDWIVKERAKAEQNQGEATTVTPSRTVNRVHESDHG